MTLKEISRPLDRIGRLCQAYADALSGLTETVEEVREMQRRAIRSNLRRIRSQTAAVSAAKGALEEALEESPELFERPRTREMAGIEVGYRKQPGRFDVPDADATIARIRAKHPKLAASLINVKESLDKAAMRKVDAGTLAQVGVTIVDVDDEVVIRVAGGDVDKLVAALLDDVKEEVDAA